MVFASFALDGVSSPKSPALDEEVIPTQPKWVYAQYETVIPKVRELSARFSSDSQSRFNYNEAELLRLKSALQSISSSEKFDESQRGQMDRLLNALTQFESANVFPYDMSQYFYLGALQILEGGLSEALQKIAGVKEIMGFLSSLSSLDTEDEAAQLAHQVIQSVQEQNEMPTFCFYTSSSIMGVGTMLTSFMQYGVAPVPVVGKGSSVHGRLVEGPFSTALHDLLHGRAFSRAMKKDPLCHELKKVIPWFKSLMKEHNYIGITQLHLILHEETVDPASKFIISMQSLKDGVLANAKSPLLTERERIQNKFEMYWRGVWDSLAKEGEKKPQVEFSEDHVKVYYPSTEVEQHYSYTLELKDNGKYGYKMQYAASGVEGDREENTYEGTFSVGPSADILRRNISDWAWLCKQAGLFPPERSLKKDPLNDQEMYETVQRLFDQHKSPFWA